MIEIFQLLFGWLPDSIRTVVIALLVIFILSVFIDLIMKIIQLIRG